jgi:hypothetical protein
MLDMETETSWSQKSLKNGAKKKTKIPRHSLSRVPQHDVSEVAAVVCCCDWGQLQHRSPICLVPRGAWVQQRIFGIRSPTWPMLDQRTPPTVPRPIFIIGSWQSPKDPKKTRGHHAMTGKTGGGNCQGILCPSHMCHRHHTACWNIVSLPSLGFLFMGLWTPIYGLIGLMTSPCFNHGTYFF